MTIRSLCSVRQSMKTEALPIATSGAKEPRFSCSSEEMYPMNQLAKSITPEVVGRYLLYPAIARGGMATVHTARLVGAEGFTRLVAAKRLHPQYTDDPEFVRMF